MSRIPSRPARAAVRGVAASPAVAGFRPAAIAVAAAFALGAHAQSVPIGAVHGTATFERNGNNLLVTTTNGAGHRSVINWQTFGVPGGSTTYFQQPDAASTSINRVTGGVRSDIFGTLGSNGRLVLVNPSGIAIGAGAMVDTGGFTASTLNLSQDDAIAGRLLFQGGGAGLTVGEGARILARNGDVVLVGSQVQVERNAVVRADGATILAAGEKVEITGRGLEGIRLEVQAGNEAVNLGTLQGDAVGIFAGTLKHSGLVQAQGVTAAGGKVVLQAIGGDNLVDGTVVAAAQGGKGGSIDVLGQRVALLAGATLDASGASGGGSIRVGGDYQGANADVPNAQAVYVDAAANINADATVAGDGGRVIVWSDGLTQMHGRISARGGAQGGDGGFAEVSGKKILDFTGRADLRATQGRTGTLLLDPNDIVIDASTSTDTPGSTPAPAVWQYSGGTGTSHIKESDLEAQLATSNVVVLTNGGSGGNGDITVASGVDIAWTGDYTLALQADRNIILDGSITATGANSVLSMQALGGDITQGASSTVTVSGLLANAKGNVTMTGANMVNRLSGNTTLDGGNGNFTFNNGKDITLATVSTAWGASFHGINAGSGDVTVTTTAGSITVGDTPGTTPPPAVSGGQVRIEAAQDVNMQRGVQANGLAKIKAVAGRIDQRGDARVDAGSVEMNASSDIALNGVVRANGDITLTSNNGGISFYGLDSSGYSETLDRIQGGKVKLQAKGDVTGSYIYADGAYYYGEGGNVSGHAGKVDVTSSTGSIDIDNIYARPGEDEGWGVGGGAAGEVKLLTRSAAAGDIRVDTIDVSGSNGENATAGGRVEITAGRDVSLRTIRANGGASSTGTGGQGGEVHVTTAGQLTFFATEGGGIQADGGMGGNDEAGNGLRGGKGGKVSVTHSGGDMVADSSWLVSASGGQGGDSVGSNTAGGQGGDGGEISISAAGRLQLSSPRIWASGGQGGYYPDDSTAMPGVNGTFRAGAGSTVDVTSNFELYADWINDAVVRAQGDTWLYVAGMFRNNKELQLSDTASVDADFGLVNAGLLKVSGTNAANLTLNETTGTVIVASGSTLSTPAFLVNKGTVQVDGTLSISDPLRPALDVVADESPSSGTLFTNESTGTLTGNGSIVVSGGTGTVQNFGTIAPGGTGSVGTLTLDANLVMEPGSTLAADLLNTASHDKLVVTGAVVSGGTVAANYLPGASFAAGDRFTVLQSGGLDATTVPGVNKPELAAQASGNDMQLVANAVFPAPAAPILPPDQQNAVQQSNNQVVTFAELFMKMAEEQEKDRIGKDDIVITDTACTP